MNSGLIQKPKQPQWDFGCEAGWHEVTFDAGDISSGLYLCRIHAVVAFLQTR